MGFSVKPADPGRWQVTKGNCSVLIEKGPQGVRFGERPGYVLGSEVLHLLDGGYQKFLVGPSRKLPATADHLSELHAFEEQLRYALDLGGLYNESLGTVSERYHYDRVKGRPNP